MRSDIATPTTALARWVSQLRGTMKSPDSSKKNFIGPVLVTRFGAFRLRFRLAHREPSKTVQLKRRTCQREVLGITRKRRATRRSRTGDLLITNSGQDETAQQYLGRLRNPDCSQIVPSRQRQSATSVIGTATNWFVIGGHPEAYVDPDDGGVGDVVCAQRSVVESPMFGTLPIVR